jgi:5-formyltetrahydrofolate cyclo-ligase
MEMTLSSEKKVLREKLLAQLRALTDSEIKRRSNDVCERLSHTSLYKQAKTIMAYYPLKGEVAILELIRKAKTNKRWCFPVMDSKAKNLRVFRVCHAAHRLQDSFVNGPFGVMEPDTSKNQELDFRQIDMVIVPALAFDRAKNRLGRGGGFYDRFLPMLAPPTVTVGLAFDFQIIDCLPVDGGLDQKVDTVISEREIIS